MSYILVVETEPNIRKFLTVILKKQGFEVAEATTAQEVLDQMRASLPLAVILDSRLVGMSGWELLQILTDDPELAAVPVVTMTTTPAQHADAKSRYANITTQLTKPVSRNTVVAAVQRAINNREVPSPKSRK